MKRIPLTNSDKICIVDDIDFNLVSQYTWYHNIRINSSGTKISVVVSTNKVNGKHLYLARFIMNTSKGMDTHHKNHKRLDNRRNNLQCCTPLENHRHRVKQQKTCSSQYKGVYWLKKNRRWVAQIKTNKKRILLGCFTDEKEAARAYNKAAIKYFGKFSLLNEVA